ncbi:MAG TPA: NADPH-dependent FMN reductase [Gammaproteobacteria bacterium]|nr:NADPH-dependent FMN reductase [Gammaproteobacteria bacterium]
MSTRLLAISGSLRADSTNTALLRAAAAAAPPGIEIEIYAGLGELPPFNPDLDGDTALAVRAFRAKVLAADGLIIASPEYAHGVPGALKNALDWAVSWEEFPGKPVALWHTSPYGEHAKAALAEILKTMSSCLISAAALDVNLRGKKPAEMQAILVKPEITDAISKSLAVFVRALPSCRASAA